MYCNILKIGHLNSCKRLFGGEFTDKKSKKIAIKLLKLLQIGKI